MSKSGPKLACLCILTWKCASRHNGVHFFDISTSKTGLRPQVFDTFDLEMCFAPQRRALFRHLNFQKWSEAGVFCTFKCASRHNGVHFSNIWTSKSGLKLACLCILTWKCASRHNGVHFFNIWTSKSGPKLACLCILTWKRASRHNGAHFFDSSTSKSASNVRCFYLFDLEMCFAPQRRALFHLSSGQLAPHPPL